jgi:hypothetical protein
VLPKFSEHDGSTKRRAAANRRSFTDPITVRGRMRTRSAICRSAASFTSCGAKFSSSVPTMASVPDWMCANARKSRSRRAPLARTVLHSARRRGRRVSSPIHALWRRGVDGLLRDKTRQPGKPPLPAVTVREVTNLGQRCLGLNHIRRPSQAL